MTVYQSIHRLEKIQFFKVEESNMQTGRKSYSTHIRFFCKKNYSERSEVEKVLELTVFSENQESFEIEFMDEPR